MLRPMCSLLILGLSLVACTGGSGPGTALQTGSACTSAASCYPGVGDAATIRGTVLCLDRIPGGYCTHTCTTDSDCCALSGECKGGLAQVCAPFESTGQKMCFLSCEQTSGDAGDTGDAGDANAYCATNANAAFGCRSTGGGQQNRKVCVP